MAIDAMVFHEPVFVGDEVSCYGNLVRTGRTSMTVCIEAWWRHLPSGEVRKVTEAIFTYVAIGEDRRPRPQTATGPSRTGAPRSHAGCFCRKSAATDISFKALASVLDHRIVQD